MRDKSFIYSTLLLHSRMRNRLCMRVRSMSNTWHSWHETMTVFFLESVLSLVHYVITTKTKICRCRKEGIMKRSLGLVSGVWLVTGCVSLWANMFWSLTLWQRAPLRLIPILFRTICPPAHPITPWHPDSTRGRSDWETQDTTVLTTSQ